MTDYHKEIPYKRPPRKNQIVAINEAIQGLSSVGFQGLFMEMSLGKSQSSLNVAEILKKWGALKRIVIICPKAIMSVWPDEIEEGTHLEEKPFIWENKKTAKYQREIEALLKKDFSILLVRLELFQKKNLPLKEYLKQYFENPTLVILDESSKIKSTDSNRTGNVIDYTHGAAYKLALTGTPWGESPLDIFSQMEFLHPGFWYRFDGEWKPQVLKKHWFIFRNKYAVLKEFTVSEGRKFKKVVGTRRTEEIADKIRPYVTQQKKDEWLKDMPEKQFQVLHVDMGKKQAEVYEAVSSGLIAEIGDSILTADSQGSLMGLRQIAGGFNPETKEPLGELPGIAAILEDVEEYSGKVIITAVFIAEIEEIYRRLVKVYGADQVCTYYGGTKDQASELLRFKTSARFMVLNPLSGAYGLNLQFCSLMYLYSRDFSYEKNAQLIDRIHRPNQKNTCVYKDIIHRNTVQERPLQAFKKKKNCADAFDRITFKDFIKGVDTKH